MSTNKYGTIDFSNASEGYVVINYTATTKTKLKVQVKGPKNTINYDIPAAAVSTLPLTDGNGDYTISVLENAGGTKYSSRISASIKKLTIKDENSPYLYGNIMVDYEVAEKSLAKAAELIKGKKTDVEKVSAIYSWLISYMSYDNAKASSVQSGYVPVIDSVYKAKKGICFDYAALMAGMLRNNDIPCKLQVGYAGKTYHAWISAYTEKGWITKSIEFKSKGYHRMDPTFDDTGKSSKDALAFIKNDKNYSVLYQY
ncbi:MAG: transglutaminase-like domain-containing protein [Clostridia bacterium]|nr:transglutaminase-like domain-containing protein [Clostridia bacterium]